MLSRSGRHFYNWRKLIWLHAWLVRTKSVPSSNSLILYYARLWPIKRSTKQYLNIHNNNNNIPVVIYTFVKNIIVAKKNVKIYILLSPLYFKCFFFLQTNPSFARRSPKWISHFLQWLVSCKRNVKLLNRHTFKHLCLWGKLLKFFCNFTKIFLKANSWTRQSIGNKFKKKNTNYILCN